MPRTLEKAGHEVMDLMQTVIDKHGLFSPIRQWGVIIDVLMQYGSPVKVHGAIAAAKIKVCSVEDRLAGAGDVRIVIDGETWEGLFDLSREAVLAHELCHLDVQTDCGNLKRDDAGRPEIKMRPDDWALTGFRRVVEWYGEDSVERRSLHRVAEFLAQKPLTLRYDSEEEGAEAEAG